MTSDSDSTPKNFRLDFDLPKTREQPSFHVILFSLFSCHGSDCHACTLCEEHIFNIRYDNGSAKSPQGAPGSLHFHTMPSRSQPTSEQRCTKSAAQRYTTMVQLHGSELNSLTLSHLLSALNVPCTGSGQIMYPVSCFSELSYRGICIKQLSIFIDNMLGDITRRREILYIYSVCS